MIVNLKSQTELSGFYIIYEGSTNLEKPGWYGLSHTMEHLVCKSFFHLIEDFDKFGISWNAYTDTNNIVFYFTGLDSKLNKYKEKILDVISKFEITKKEFENEGIKFAPVEIAKIFSIESDHYIYENQFGFHGFAWTDITAWIQEHPEYPLIKEEFNERRKNKSYR